MATSKGKRFKDLKCMQLFVMDPSELRWTKVWLRTCQGIYGWGGENICSKEFHVFPDNQIVYPVTLTCKLEGMK